MSLNKLIEQDLLEKEQAVGMKIICNSNPSFSGSYERDHLTLGLLTVMSHETWHKIRPDIQINNTKYNEILNLIDRIPKKEWNNIQDFVIHHEIGHSKDPRIFDKLPHAYLAFSVYTCYMRVPLSTILCVTGLLFTCIIPFKRYNEKKADLYSVEKNKTITGAKAFFSMEKDKGDIIREKNWWGKFVADEWGHLRYDVIHPHPLTRLKYMEDYLTSKNLSQN